MKPRKLIFFFSFFLLALPAAAAALTLAELQKLALENREVVQRYLVNLEKSELDRTIAQSGYLPSLDVSYTMNALDESSLFEDSTNSVAYGAVSINVFSGFRDKYSVESAALLQRVEERKLQGLRQDIMLNVALRYLAIYDREASLRVAADALETLQKIYQDAENRFKVGIIDKNELLRFKVDLDNAAIVSEKAKADLAKSVRLLAREVDSQISLADLSFEDLDVPPELPEYGQCEERMLANRSDVQALEELIGVAENSVQIARAGYLPSVDVKGSYRNYDDDLLNGGGAAAEDELRAQLVLSMNLFDGWSKSSTLGKARLDVRAARYDLAELKNDLQAELENLFLDFGVSRANTLVAETSIEQADENLRITRLRYQQGIERESDLLDAVTNLSRARSNLIIAKTEAYANKYRITRMIEAF